MPSASFGDKNEDVGEKENIGLLLLFLFLFACLFNVFFSLRSLASRFLTWAAFSLGLSFRSERVGSSQTAAPACSHLIGR